MILSVTARKHIEGKYHHIYIFVGFQRRVNMIVDPLTKPFSHEVFGKHVKTMGLLIFE